MDSEPVGQGGFLGIHEWTGSLLANMIMLLLCQSAGCVDLRMSSGSDDPTNSTPNCGKNRTRPLDKLVANSFGLESSAGFPDRLRHWVQDVSQHCFPERGLRNHRHGLSFRGTPCSFAARVSARKTRTSPGRSIQLTQFGCETIFQQQVSNVQRDRPQPKAALREDAARIDTICRR